jgi:hypothetical protein
MNTVPSYDLEVRAVDQRAELRTSITRLRSQLRQTLDRAVARHRTAVLIGTVTSVIVLFGYLTRHLVRAFERRRQSDLRSRKTTGRIGPPGIVS